MAKYLLLKHYRGAPAPAPAQTDGSSRSRTKTGASGTTGAEDTASTGFSAS